MGIQPAAEGFFGGSDLTKFLILGTFVKKLLFLFFMTLAAATIQINSGEYIASELHSAAKLGRLDKVVQLLNAGADIDNLDSWEGATPLHEATEGDKEEMAELLIMRGADVDKPTDPYKSTPLMCAAYLTRGGIAQLLLQHKANVNAQNVDGKTALMLVTAEFMVKLLLEHQADINPDYIDGDTALDRANKKTITLFNAKQNKQSAAAAADSVLSVTPSSSVASASPSSAAVSSALSAVPVLAASKEPYSEDPLLKALAGW